MTIPNSTVRQTAVESGEVLSLTTGADVFTPLSDTTPGWEFLREKIDALPSKDGLVLADFGSGTGQFAVFAKWTYPTMTVKAYEKSAAAEKYIKENLTVHAGLAEDAIEINIQDVATIDSAEKFDIIVSCPPYIPDIVKTMSIPHSHSGDPEETWNGGYKGLEVQTVFINKAAETLKAGGILLVVHTKAQKDEVDALLLEKGFSLKTAPVHYDPGTPEMALVDPQFTFATK